MLRILTMLVGIFGLVSTTVLAQSPGEGLLNAVSYKPIPAGATLSVRALDNSDSNLAVQEDFERELRGLGFSIGSNAGLVLSFETRDVVGAYSEGVARHVMEFSGGGGRGGGEDARARVNMFDSASGGVLNRGRDTGDTTIITPTQYRIDATVEDRTSGRRLWQAWAVADLEQSDGRTLTRAMVPAIANALGDTVRQQPFAVR
jgi:hypothetical protein